MFGRLLPLTWLALDIVRLSWTDAAEGAEAATSGLVLRVLGVVGLQVLQDSRFGALGQQARSWRMFSPGIVFRYGCPTLAHLPYARTGKPSTAYCVTWPRLVGRSKDV
jgi:hypothetical protein